MTLYEYLERVSRFLHRKAIGPRAKRRSRYPLQPASEVLESRWLLSALASSSILDSYNQNPLNFEPNRGQTASQVQFLSRGQGYALDLTPDEAVLGLQQSSTSSNPTAAASAAQPAPAVLTMQLVGASATTVGAGLDQLASTTNYLGATQATSLTGIPNYGQVEYQNVYPGINLIYFGNQQQLEFNFVVAPGADPHAIALQFQGADSIALDSAGDLVLHTAGGNVVEDAPVVYQMIDGVKQTVSGVYVMQGANQVGFQLGTYDHSQPLVIDPVVVYSTYLGGSGDDVGSAIAVDSSGNTYVTGYTNSLNFVPPFSSLLPTFIGGTRETYVAKFNPAGQIVSSTYLGGVSTGLATTYNAATSIAVDKAGDVFLTGYSEYSPTSVQFGNALTTLTPFPSPIGPSVFALGAFVTELNPQLNNFVYSTYLGTSGSSDEGVGIAVDAAGDAYVAGTYYGTYPNGWSGIRTGVSFDVPFVAKLDPSGNVLWDNTINASSVSTLASGDTDFGNYATGIALDANGNAYVVGSTDSSSFGSAVLPAAANPAGYDVFVMKVLPDGAQSYLVQVGGADSTLGNTDGDNYGNAIAVDTAGDVYVTGATDSDEFPTVNPIQEFNQAQDNDPAGDGGTNAFVFDLNPAGTQLLYSTYLGGSGGAYTSFDGSLSPEVQGEDSGSGIAVDSSGDMFIVGTTNSTNFPTTDNAVQPSFGQGGLDAFVTELNSTGSGFVNSTFYSGSGADASSQLGIDAYDEGSGIAVDQYGTAYITGFTTSADFPTANAAQSTFGGGALETSALDAADQQYPPDAFVVAISNQNLIVTPKAKVNAAIGQVFSGPVATFTAPNPNLPGGDYTATINWGDGSSPDIVTPSSTGNPAAPYQVSGTHTYTAIGDFSIVVTVTDTFDKLQATTGVDASSLPVSQAEPTVAVNPTETNNLFVASAYGATGASGFGAYSMDGGATWQLTNGGNIGTGYGPGGDNLPVDSGNNFTAAFDRFGNLYLTYVANNQSGQQEIAVAWSTNGGETFQLLAQYPGVKADQPKVTTGPGPTPGTASVLISFTYGTPYQVYVVGAVVSGFGVAPTLSADPVAVPAGSGALDTDVAVGPSGQVAVTWAHYYLPTDPNEGDIYLSLDSQGLNNLSSAAFQQTPTLEVGDANLLGTFIAVPAAPFRGISGVQPWIGFDDSNGPNRGRLYLLYSSSSEALQGSTSLGPPVNGTGVQDGGNFVLSVNLVYSTDNGATFSPASSIVNNSGGDELIPNLAVDPITGDVAVGFYATSSPTSPVTAFYTTLSNDGGQTFSAPQQVSIGSTNLVTNPSGPNNPLQYSGNNTDQYGDYSGLAFYNGVIFPAWVDNSSQLEGNPNTPNSDIAVARVTVAHILKPIPVVSAQSVVANVGQSFTQTVATFTDPGQSTAAQFTVTINWGDGTTPSTVTPTQPGGPGTVFFVTGTHTYTSAGAYPIVVTVIDTAYNTSATSVSDATPLRVSQLDAASAVNPNNSLEQVVASLFQLTPGAASSNITVSSTTNGGATWNATAIGTPYDFFPAAASGNLAAPSVTFDQFGNVFLSYRAADLQSLILLESTDGGQTFTLLNDFNLPGAQGTATLAPGSLAVGPGGASGPGSVWVSYRDVANDQLVVAGAQDTLAGVGTFSSLIVPNSSNAQLQCLAVGPKGQVLVSFLSPFTSAPATIYVSTDSGGLGGTFSTPVAAATTNVQSYLTIPADPNWGISAQATLVFDQSSSDQYNGRVYLVYTNTAPAGSIGTHIYERYSTDSGRTWSSPVQVDNGTSDYAFLPSASVDPSTGELGIVWYDTRNDALNNYAQVYAAISSNGGFTFSGNVPISPGASYAGNPGIDSFGQANGYGTHLGLSFVSGVLGVAWADNSVQMNFPSVPDFNVAAGEVGVAVVTVPQPPVVTGLPISTTEGSTFSGKVATFTDAIATLTSTDFTATINWGDGSSSLGTITPSGAADNHFIVRGTHPYVVAGAYVVTVTVTDNVNNVTGTTETDVSQMPGNQTDGTIAVDPTSPNSSRLFSASAEEGTGLFVASSGDGGVTWTGKTIAAGGDSLPVAGGQPQAAFDQFGNLYLAYVDQTGQNIVVLMSTDGGQSFTTLEEFNSPSGVSRPLIAIGPGPNGTASVWLTFLDGTQQIDATGIDADSLGVVGVFNPVQIVASATAAATLNLGGVAVGPLGQVLVSYQTQTSAAGPSAIYVALDANGLSPGGFGPPVLVTNTNVGGADTVPPQATHTIGTGASLAWDTSGGQNNGRVYLVYTDAAAVGSQATEIFLRYSDNNGMTWSAPVQVSDYTGGNSEFLPSIAVDENATDPTAGDVGVAWYDARNDPNDVATQFFAATSINGGRSFSPNVPVSLGSSDATNGNLDAYGQQNQYGDYTSLAFAGGILYPVWADNSTQLSGNPDLPQFNLAEGRPAVAPVADLPLSATPLDISSQLSYEGAAFTANLATFTDPDPDAQVGLYTATINWGDPDPITGAADTTTGTITANGGGMFTVSGTHAYQGPGAYTITITIQDIGGSTVSVTTPALIQEAPLYPGGNVTLTAYVGQPLQGVVGTFTSPNPNGAPDDYSTTIDWGDGQQSSGLVTFAGSAALTYDSADSTLYTFGNNDLVAGNPPYLMAISLQGVVTPVAPVDDTYYGGLAFDPNNGTLYALSNAEIGVSTLMSFNFSTQTFSPVAELGSGFTGGLAFNSAEGNLYAISGADGGAWQIDQISPSDGSVTVLGALSPPGNQPPLDYTGLSFSGNGNLYAVGNDSDGNSTLYQITLGSSVTTAPLFSLGNDLTTPPSSQEGFTGGLAYVPGTGSLLTGDLIGISGDGSGTTYMNTIDLDGTTASVFEVFVAGPGKSGSGDFSNGFNIIGTHTYTQATTAPLTITITDVEPVQVPGSVVSSTYTDLGTVTVVANLPPQPLPAPPPFTAFEGDSTGVLNLASFTIATGGATSPTDYSATINWNDGSPLDTGVVAISGTTLTVSGSHTYASAGSFNPTVVLAYNTSGGSVTVTDAFTVLADVTSQVHAVSSGLIYNPSTQLFNGDVTFTDTSAATLTGPFPLVFQGLPAGVTLADATGATGAGIPYISDTLPTLAPGQSSTVAIQFQDPQLVPITYTLQIIDPSIAPPNPSTEQQISYDQLPLSFEPNEGQTDSQVQYLAQGSGYALFLTSDQAVLSLDSSSSSASAAGTPSAGEQSVLEMQLVGANPAATAVGLDQLAGKSNYFIGSDASQWITNVTNYGEVQYQQIYPGIALDYLGNQGQLEYDFSVAPGADPSIIKLAIQGAESLTLDAQGDLILGTAVGDVVEHAPNIYQEIGGTKVIVPGTYVLLGQDQVGFAVGAYDRSQPLLIDPVLVYSTYLAGSLLTGDGEGSGTSAGISIASDAAGNAYVTGTTNFANFPTTPGAFQTGTGNIFDGASEAFVTKLNAAGTAIVYSTYLEPTTNTGFDTVGTSIAVDGAGEAYITGYTDSAGLPTVNAFQSIDNYGQYYAFVAKLNASGSALVFCTYLGGSGNGYAANFGNSIAVDSSGNAYVVGGTDAGDFPTTAGALQPNAHSSTNEDYSPGQQGEGFVAKFSSTGSLIYSTYLGGSLESSVYGVAVDAAGDAYVTGATTAADFPIVNPIQATLTHTEDDTDTNAFIAELNPAGLALVYSTFYEPPTANGTYPGLDSLGLSIAVDATGAAYVTGYQDLIATSTGVIPYNLNGGLSPNTAFVMKLSPGGTALVYSTSVMEAVTSVGGLYPEDPDSPGGAGYSGQRIAVNSQGDAYVAGEDWLDTTGNAYYYGESNALQSPSGDAIVYEFNPSGAVVESTLVGGNLTAGQIEGGGQDNQTLGSGIAVDPTGNVYLTGWTDLATGFPTTPGALQPSTNVVTDQYAFVTKIAAPPKGQIQVTAEPIQAIAGTSFTGVVASFTDTDGDPIGNYTATINWGDGGPSAGLVSANADGGFNVSGTHTFVEAGFYPIVITVSDSDGSTASASTTVVETNPSGDITYPIEVNTSALAGTTGSLVLQFNPGATPNAQSATVTVSNVIVMGGSLTPAITDEGGASGSLSGTAQLTNSTVLNEIDQGITFGSSVIFDITISGAAVEQPGDGDFASTFAVQVLGADGVTPQDTVDPSGSVNTVDVNPDGSTRVTNFASSAQGGPPVAGTFNVADAPLSATGTTLQTTAGTPFTAVIATFTSVNPNETLSDYLTPTIAWGDGQTSAGTLTLGNNGAFDVTGTHTYADAGTYTARVTITDIFSSVVTAATTITVEPVVLSGVVPTVSVAVVSLGAGGNNPTLLATAVEPGGSGVASVQLQYSADGGATWLNAGAAETAAPFTYTFPTPLPDGTYQARAIATDNEGNTATAYGVFTTIVSFSGDNGYEPYGGVIDVDGTLFGTTADGGAFSAGNVFELDASTGVVTNLFSFNGANGAYPSGRLFADGSGNLFGTTGGDGADNDGTVFELNPNTGVLTTLATFTGPNGAYPNAGLIADSSGNLYGTTLGDGTDNDGTVFELNPSSGVLTTLATFTGPNGASPASDLLMDGSGNLFGTTVGDGTDNEGTVFELNPNSGVLTTLATFTGPNGAYPSAGLIADASGNLYGTTAGDGTDNDGTVFELNPNSGVLTTLATFTVTNGAYPDAGLVADASGNLYGTTSGGGADQEGTVFELDPSTGALTTVVTFNGTNGLSPSGSLIFDSSSGALYGTAVGGGSADDGTVFELSPATFTINSLTATIDVSSVSVPFDGQPHGTTAEVYGTGNVDLGPATITYPQGVIPVDAGTYSVTASFAGNSTYAAQTVTIPDAITITQATPLVSASNASATFTGSPQPYPGGDVTVTGADGLGNSDGTLSYTYNGSATVPVAAGSYAVVVTFTPTDANDYAVATGTATWTIKAATPGVTANNDSTTYTGSPQPYPGGDVTVTGANGLNNTDGTLSYTYNGSATVPVAAGSYAVVVTFTPTDANDYAVATGTATWTIKAATPGVTANNDSTTYTGSPQPYPGGDVTVTGANGLNNTDGTLSYTYNGSATVPTTTGSYVVVVTFTPTDANDYAIATGTATWTIKAATPTITWAAPPAIIYGAPLGATQLDATASVPGSFVYAPAAGTVLTAGAQTLSVTFTPTDTTDYTTATQSVQLTVKQATPTITWATPAAITYGTALSVTQLDATAGVPGSFVYAPAAGTVLTAGTQTLSVTSSPTDTTDYSTATLSVQLTVDPLPALKVPASVSVNENGSLTFSGGNAISVTDTAGSGNDNESLTLSTSHGTLSLGTQTGLTVSGTGTTASPLTLSGALSALNADLPSLVYMPTSGYSGSDNLSLSILDTTDQAQGAPAQVAIAVNSVKQPPTVSAPSTATVNENASLTFCSGNSNAITVTDAAAAGSSDSLTLTVTNGTLTLGSTAGLTFTSGSNGTASMTVTGTLASLNATLSGLKFTPTCGYCGSASLVITVKDSGDGLTGSATVAIAVNSVKHPPTVSAPPTASVNENASLTFCSSDCNAITVTDVAASGSSDSLTLTVTNGTLTLGSTAGLKFTSGSNGTASMTVTGTLASLNAAVSGLKFTPTRGYCGSASLVITVKDSGDGLSGSATVAITVNAVKQPPTVSAPSTASVNENASLTFCNSNAITVTDAATSGSSDSLTLTVTNGTLTLGSTTGLKFTSGSNGTASMTVTGTLASLNAALSGLKFTPTCGYCGSASLLITVNDSGDSLTGSATVTIAVNSVKQPPK